MKKELRKYSEKLEEEFSIRHKISSLPEKKHVHIHSQLEIVLTCSDDLKCQLENQVMEVPVHHLMLFNNMDLHYLFMDQPGLCDRYVIYFSPEYISGYSTPVTNLLDCFFQRPDNRPEPLPVPPEKLGTLLHLAEAMEHYHSLGGHGYGSDLHVKFLLGQFLLMTNELFLQYHHMDLRPARMDYNMVYDIFNYIHEHYSQDGLTEEITKEFFISRTQLYQIFRQMNGSTPGSYLIHYRITRAKELLLQNDDSVERIGEMVGYANLSHFSRVFKQHTGYSPKQYQSLHLNGVSCLKESAEHKQSPRDQ